MIISALTQNPIVWQISKVENHAPKGIQKITFYQTKYNAETDFVDFETGEMYADYYQNASPPTDSLDDYNKNVCEIVTATNIIKVGGGYKTITAALTSEDDAIKNDNYSIDPVWEFFIGEINITDSDLIKILRTDTANKIKVKFNGGSEYIQKDLKIKCTIGDVAGELLLNISSI